MCHFLKHHFFINVLKRYFPALLCSLLVCCGPKNADTRSEALYSIIPSAIDTNAAITNHKSQINDFVPSGYKLFDTIKGDLNNDGFEDCVLIIKGTDSSKVITDAFRGVVDRNRRGMIILINKNNHYDLFMKHLNCFASDCEDGGVYYAPELSVEIKKCKLYIYYRHGRYGFWGYVFRHQNLDFELIGYSSSENQGPIVVSETSINFSTKEKIVKVNTNLEISESGEEVFETIKSKISTTKLFKLSEIKDFDQLDLSHF